MNILITGATGFIGQHLLKSLSQEHEIHVLIRPSGNSIGGNKYRDSKDISGTIPEMFEQGMAFLKSNLHSVQAGQSFNSIGKLEIPETALEELLQNALVHRDYLRSAPIRLIFLVAKHQP